MDLEKKSYGEADSRITGNTWDFFEADQPGVVLKTPTTPLRQPCCS